VSDCLSPTGSLRPGKHHKLSEVGNVDTPPARPMTPLEARLAEEEAQSQQAEGQAGPKRLRVTPLVRPVSAVIFNRDKTKVAAELTSNSEVETKCS